MARSAHHARGNPMAVPAVQSTIDSVRSCEAKRRRPAPKAVRSANSRWRDAVSARIRLAMLPQAISSTQPAAPNRMSSAGRRPLATSSSRRTRLTPRLPEPGNSSGGNRRTRADISSRATGSATPGFKRPKANADSGPRSTPISIEMGVDLGPESAFAFGRLKPGVALPVARDEMSALVRRLPPDELPGSGKRGVNLVRLDEEVASGLRPALLILFGAAGCVLLIACGNIANLILAD